jgi:methylated-DNA-[protein]-cysteine S-methyltransferase
VNTTTVTHDTPIGRLTLAASEHGLTRVRPHRPSHACDESGPGRRRLDLARDELDAYFAGHLHRFTVPVDLRRVGEPHRRILEALSDIGHGERTTYGALATRLGSPTTGRARSERRWLATRC